MDTETLIARAEAALEALDIMAVCQIERDAKAAKLMTKQLRDYLTGVARMIGERKFA